MAEFHTLSSLLLQALPVKSLSKPSHATFSSPGNQATIYGYSILFALSHFTVYRSLKHIYAQIIDDQQGHTIIGVSSLSPEIRETVKYGGNVAAAKAVGKLVAQKALEKNITEVVFDRAGFKYHGRVAALANEVREAGIEF